MSGDDIGRLMYLVLLGTVIVGYFLVQNRQNLGKSAQHAAVWGLIFVGVIAGVGLWGDIRTNVTQQQIVFSEENRIEVPRSPDGHFYLVVKLNDIPVRFVVDTGATDVVLNRRDARRIGIDLAALQYFGQANTANGPVRTARTKIDTVQLGANVDHDLVAWVNEGEMEGSLLGMAYLRRFSKIEIARDTLILSR